MVGYLRRQGLAGPPCVRGIGGWTGHTLMKRRGQLPVRYQGLGRLSAQEVGNIAWAEMTICVERIVAM